MPGRLVSDLDARLFEEFCEEIGGEPSTMTAGLYEEPFNLGERTAVLLGIAEFILAQVLFGQPKKVAQCIGC
jgi:hypothetical protein